MKSYVQTFSVVVPGNKCNAHCPYCVSKMTGYEKTGYNQVLFDRNLIDGARYAVAHGATTCLITGKGEPLIYYSGLLSIVEKVSPFFPVIEVQTNGILIKQFCKLGRLTSLFENGLKTVSISCVSINREENQKIFGDKYMELSEMINDVHSSNLSVRLSLLGVRGYVDTSDKLREFVDYSRKHNVEQITFRDINKPLQTLNKSVSDWVADNSLDDRYYEIQSEIQNGLVALAPLAHGSDVYDWNGQNICFANCLTESSKKDNQIRQLILFPDGHVRYSWQYAGAILF